MTATSPPRRAVLALLGLPPGSGLLFTRGTKARLLLALGGLLVIALLEVVALAVVLQLVQVLTGTDPSGPAEGALAMIGLSSTSSATSLALVVLGIYVAKALFTIAFRWWLFGLMAREQTRTATELFAYYLRAPYPLHLRRSGSDLIATSNDAVNQVYQLVVTGSVLALADLVTVAAIAVTLLVAYPVQTVAVTVYFLVAVLLFQRAVRRRAIVIGRQVIEGATGAYRTAMDSLAAVKEVKVNGVADQFVERYRRSRRQSTEANRRNAFIAELPKHVLEILFVLGIGITTAISFAQDDPAQTLAVIALFATAGFRALPSVVRAMASLNGVRVGRHSLGRVLDDLRAARAAPAPPRSGTRLQLDREVRLDHVSFAYDDGVPVLTDVELTIPRGASVALVGRSGAGKSTLVDLVLGLLEPSSGRVTVDGSDLSGRVDAWWRCVGVVPQPVSLLDGTIRENVAFGIPPDEVDDASVWTALRRADLADTVTAMPAGLDTPTGERGVKLSGGQRQRLGIARALYRDPVLLVLDEATSALDNETERRISETVSSLQRHTTTLVVAHRLSTVRHCDTIVLLSEGRVEATGTFDELRATSTEFARMVELGALT